MNSPESSTFRPTAPLENLRLRALLYRSIRRFFDARDFVETTTPFVSRDAVVDRFVEPISVEISRCWHEKDDFAQKRFADPEISRRESTTFYLQTSPEFAMKRLIAAGMNAIYQLAPACRRGDRGPLHNVEFTMLEWYRRDDDYLAARRFLGDLIRGVALDFFAESGISSEKSPNWVSWADNPVVERSFSDVFAEKTGGLDPHSTTCDELRQFADSAQIPYPASFLDAENAATKDDWLDLLFSEVVQPTLGFDAATILFDYPASQSQLAKTRREIDAKTGREIEFSERFELFINGIELANGYNELLDAEILRRRVRETSAERRRDGSPELPVESRLLQAMTAGLPTCAGCALGVDRFFMTLIDAATIDEVLPFPIEIA